jgi:hypothetical protein
MFIIIGSSILFIYGVLIIGLFMVTSNQRQVTIKTLEVLKDLSYKLDSLINTFDETAKPDMNEK